MLRRCSGTNKGAQSCISILKVNQSFKRQQSLEIASWIFRGFLRSERRMWLNKSIEEAVLHEENKNYAELVRCKLLKSLHTMIEPYFLFSWIACKSCCLCGSHVPSSPVQTYPLATCFCSWATPPGCAKEATAVQNNTLVAVPMVVHLFTWGPKMFIAHGPAQSALSERPPKPSGPASCSEWVAPEQVAEGFVQLSYMHP